AQGIARKSERTSLAGADHFKSPSHCWRCDNCRCFQKLTCGAYHRRIGDTGYRDVRAIYLLHGLDSGGPGDKECALDEEIGRTERDSLFALVIDGHEGDIDRARAD